MKKYPFAASLSIAASLVLIAMLWAAPVMAQCSHSNSALLFIDGLGWNGVACRKNALSIPNIDVLRSDGPTFSRAHAASPTCSTGRASVITGQHPRLRSHYSI